MPPELLPGTLDFLILKILTLGPRHGYGIAQRLRQISQEVLRVKQGSLYPALHRLEQQKWIRAEWRISDTGREARFYELTARGRRHLADAAMEWSEVAEAIRLVLAHDEA